MAHRHCLVLVFGVPLTRCTNQKATASFVTQPKKAQPEMKAACAAALALALAVVLASPAAAFYEKNSAVVTLVRFPLVFLNIFFFFCVADAGLNPTQTPDNFKDEVLDSAHLWIVEFYGMKNATRQSTLTDNKKYTAPWCGHCQRLKPDYEKAATNLKGLVKLGAVDCDAEQNKPLCGQYGIQGFPTIKVFPSQPAPNKKEKKPTGTDTHADQALIQSKQTTRASARPVPSSSLPPLS